MGDKSIKNSEKKKKKKTEVTTISAPSTYERPIVTQPEVIKKKKKEK